MCCSRSKALARVSSLRATTSISAAPATSWAKSSRAISSEVGFELYQAMLEEAVASLKDGEADYEDANEWSPQISLGMPVMIPEHYVPDLQVRMQLYRQLGDLKDARRDRCCRRRADRPLRAAARRGRGAAQGHPGQGAVPDRQRRKGRSRPQRRRGHAAQQRVPQPGRAGAAWCPTPAWLVRLKPDQKLVFARDWPNAGARLKGTAAILNRMAKLAEE